MTTTEQRADSPPRENLLRTAPIALRAASEMPDENDGLTFDGWGAVFGRETIIDSWEGKFREKVMPGSMKKSFRENPPKIQFDHGHHPLIGSIPIASLRSATEETDPVYAPDGGAHVVARLMDNWLIQPVRDAIASDPPAINGMSFRFSVIRDVWFDNEGKQIRDEAKLFDMLRQTWYEDVPDDELMLRELRELKVPEIGPVVWPAYEETSASVRSKTFTVDFGSLQSDPEQRKELARAVFLADAAERMKSKEEESPQVTEDEESEEDTRTADEHEESEREQEEAPQSTESESPAGEHPSRNEVPKSYLGAVSNKSWYLPGKHSRKGQI